jgi:uncharacterized protein (TIGR00369 family)
MPEHPIWQRPVRGSAASTEIFGLTGLDQFRVYQQRRAEWPPISYWCGLIGTDAGPGSATFTMPVSPWLGAWSGAAWGGSIAMLADAALGCAVLTSLPSATPMTTSEIALSVVRPLPSSGTLAARASLVHGRRRTSLSTVDVLDERGRLLAHGTSRCAVMPRIDLPARTLEDFPVLPDEVFARPFLCDEPLPPFRTFMQADYDAHTGLELVQMSMRHEIDPSPIEEFMGSRYDAASEGEVHATLPAHGWLAQGAGVVQGGVTACFADAAMVGAIATTCGPRTVWAPIDMRMVFLRPVQPDGRPIRVHARVMHRSRTMGYAEARVTNADGKLVALAWNTALVLPDQTWADAVGVARAESE